MTGVIIVNQIIGHNAYKISRFIEEFSKFNINISVVINDGTIAVVEADKITINIPKCDFVLYLDKDIYLARILEKEGYRLFNKADFIKLCDDKMLTMIRCSQKGYSLIKTLPGPLIYSDTLTKENFLFLDDTIKELGLPLVVKKNYGSLGEGVYLATTKEELYDLYSRLFKEPVLFQKYISTSAGKSIRALVIDGKLIGMIERHNDTDFRSNFGKTNYSTKYNFNDDFRKIIEQIADDLEIEYAGIDLLIDVNDKPTLCEINSNAFFEEFEKTTKINVAKMFVEMVIRKIGYEQK